MKKLNILAIIDISLVIWIGIWFYYLAFNWDVFIAKLNTDLGFTTIQMYPFVVFFLIGLIILLIIKYALHYEQVQVKNYEKHNKDKMSLLQKDLEISKLKEVLFKMQQEGMNKNTNTINSLHAKLEELSKQFDSDKSEDREKEDDEMDDKDDKESKG